MDADDDAANGDAADADELAQLEQALALKKVRFTIPYRVPLTPVKRA